MWERGEREERGERGKRVREGGKNVGEKEGRREGEGAGDE